MKVWSIFNPATGLFTGATFFGDDAGLALNIPPGCDVIPGAHDHLSRRIVDGVVVDFRPPQPSPDHEWNDTTKRWQPTAAAQAAELADQQARAVIAMTEQGSARAIREALLEVLPKNSVARQKLQDADDLIAAERPKIKANP